MSNLYHVLNRGVEGRRLFLDSSDYVRFVHNLYEFNDKRPAVQSTRRSSVDVGFTKSNIRKRVVDIHGWCLMQNHYHLLLSEREEGGLTLFLRKLNVGYANYFNERYRRDGTLFQGRTKKVPIRQDRHFLYILHYLHLNPLDYLENAKEWRERSKGGIKNVREAFEYLNDYRWSSYLDYTGTKNFPSLITTSLFKPDIGNYSEQIKSYLEEVASDHLSFAALE